MHSFVLLSKSVPLVDIGAIRLIGPAMRGTVLILPDIAKISTRIRDPVICRFRYGAANVLLRPRIKKENHDPVSEVFHIEYYEEE